MSKFIWSNWQRLPWQNGNHPSSIFKRARIQWNEKYATWPELLFKFAKHVIEDNRVLVWLVWLSLEFWTTESQSNRYTIRASGNTIKSTKFDVTNHIRNVRLLLLVTYSPLNFHLVFVASCTLLVSIAYVIWWMLAHSCNKSICTPVLSLNDFDRCEIDLQHHAHHFRNGCSLMWLEI